MVITNDNLQVWVIFIVLLVCLTL